MNKRGVWSKKGDELWEMRLRGVEAELDSLKRGGSQGMTREEMVLFATVREECHAKM